jgi:hypothetical protein
LFTTHFWVREIQLGREDLHDEHRSGRPDLARIVIYFIPIGAAAFRVHPSNCPFLNIDHAAGSRHFHETLLFNSC